MCCLPQNRLPQAIPRRKPAGNLCVFTPSQPFHTVSAVSLSWSSGLVGCFLKPPGKSKPVPLRVSVGLAGMVLAQGAQGRAS